MATALRVLIAAAVGTAGMILGGWLGWMLATFAYLAVILAVGEALDGRLRDRDRSS